MNTRLILDASIIVKLIAQEPGSTIAEQLFEDDRFNFAAPAHAFAEVTEVLCRKLRDGSIGDRQLREALIWLPVSFAYCRWMSFLMKLHTLRSIGAFPPMMPSTLLPQSSIALRS